MTERIDHAAKASEALESARETPAAPEVVADPWLLAAQVNAMLALVEQQRIANLIALMDSPRASVLMANAALNRLSEGEPFARRDFRADIREGLGLS